MSIATEIQRLQQAKAYIKSAIEEKGVTVGDGTIDTYAEKISEISVGGSGDYEQGYEDGKQEEYDRFWNAVQDNGNRTDYTTAFYSQTWNDTTFNPKYAMKPTEAREMFRNSHITSKEKFANIDFSVNKNFYMTFQQGHIVELPIIDASNGTDFYYMCQGCYTLKSIEKLILSDKATRFEGAFSGCGYLENIIIEGVIPQKIDFGSSPLLNDASIQSIIDHLKDLTGGTVQTLTLHATVGGKLTDEQKATITAKNWTLVY